MKTKGDTMKDYAADAEYLESEGIRQLMTEAQEQDSVLQYMMRRILRGEISAPKKYSAQALRAEMF